MTTAWPVFTNTNYFFDKKKKKKIGKYTTKLTFLWYDNIGENETPLQRKSMAAILTRQKLKLR